MESPHKGSAMRKIVHAILVLQVHLCHHQFRKDKLYTIVITHECSGISFYWQLYSLFNSAYRRYEWKNIKNSAPLIPWWRESIGGQSSAHRGSNVRSTVISTVCSTTQAAKTWKKVIRLNTTDPPWGEFTDAQWKHPTESQQCEKHSSRNFIRYHRNVYNSQNSWQVYIW